MKRTSALFVGIFFPTILVLSLPAAVSAEESPKAQKDPKSITSGPIGAQALRAEPGPNPGQVILKWTHPFSDVQNYNIVFGTEPGKFQFGAVGIGKTTSYTVNYLSPNTKYYFAISPIRNGKAQYISFQVSAESKGGVVIPPPTSVNPTSEPVTGDDSFKTQPLSAIASKGVGKHQLSVEKGKNGEVILKWKNAIIGVQNYHIVYGTEPGKFQYGALNVGKVNEFKVDHLDPKKKYYFAIVPVKDGKAQYITQEVSATAPAVASGNPSGNNNNNSGGGGGSSNSNSSSSNSTTSTGTGSTTGATQSTGGTTTTTTSNTGNTDSSNNTTTTTTATTGKDSKKDEKKNNNKK